MSITATEISLVFLGLMIVMVLLEVRRLGRRTPDLEQKFDALSRRLGVPVDTPPTEMKFGGGAQIVEAGASLTALSEELERLDGSISGLEAPDYSPEGMARFMTALDGLRQEIHLARDLLGRAAAQMVEVNAALGSAGDALERVGSNLEAAIDRGGAMLEDDGA